MLAWHFECIIGYIFHVSDNDSVGLSDGIGQIAAVFFLSLCVCCSAVGSLSFIKLLDVRDPVGREVSARNCGSSAGR